MLKEVVIKNFRSEKGVEYAHVPLTYEVAGPEIGLAPIVVVNHALTGNSSVTGENGWWNKLVSDEGGISPSHYTILSFNIPGNGYDGTESLDVECFSLKDIAALIYKRYRASRHYRGLLYYRSFDGRFTHMADGLSMTSVGKKDFSYCL